ncbi:hypothetical protein Q1695_002379 [Nippostrongylus brasiliensis]|nr:hypothetical protein Q1695_002379 [Nippostrongylus brasiliensis]
MNAPCKLTALQSFAMSRLETSTVGCGTGPSILQKCTFGDNAPCHKSQATLGRLKELRVDTLPWPAESPDLNPIELVWGNMKSHIRKQNIRHLDDLKVAVICYWRSITPQMCSSYIAGMKKKLVRVVEQGGRNILEGRHS